MKLVLVDAAERGAECGLPHHGWGPCAPNVSKSSQKDVIGVHERKKKRRSFLVSPGVWVMLVGKRGFC